MENEKARSVKAFNSAFSKIEDIRARRAEAVQFVEKAEEWQAIAPNNSEVATSTRLASEAEQLLYMELLNADEDYRWISDHLGTTADTADWKQIDRRLARLDHRVTLVRMWTDVARHASNAAQYLAASNLA